MSTFLDYEHSLQSSNTIIRNEYVQKKQNIPTFRPLYLGECLLPWSELVIFFFMLYLELERCLSLWRLGSDHSWDVENVDVYNTCETFGAGLHSPLRHYLPVYVFYRALYLIISVCQSWFLKCFILPSLSCREIPPQIFNSSSWGVTSLARTVWQYPHWFSLNLPIFLTICSFFFLFSTYFTCELYKRRIAFSTLAALVLSASGFPQINFLFRILCYGACVGKDACVD